MKYFTACCAIEMESHALVKVTDFEAFEAWLMSKPHVMAGAPWYPGDVDIADSNSKVYGLDTTERETLMDAFVNELIGMRWPCYGDTDAYCLEFKNAIGIGYRHENLSQKFPFLELAE